MTDPRSPAARQEAARTALTRRRRRVWTIRRRVGGISLATLAATSAAVVIQMVTGHDPALGHATHTTTPAAHTQTRTRATSAGATSTGATSAGATASSATAPTTISSRAS